MQARRLTAIAIAASVVGCSTPQLNGQQNAIKTEASTVRLGIAQAGIPVGPTTVGSAPAADAAATAVQTRPVARRASRPWVGARMVSVQGEEVLPPILQERFNNLKFDDAAQGGRVSIAVIAERLSRIAGIPVRVKSDVYQTAGPAGAAAAQTPPAAAAASSAVPAIPLAGVPTQRIGAPSPVPGVLVAAQSGAGGPTPMLPNSDTPKLPSYRQPITDVNSVEMQWSGTLSGFLDHITARLNLSWSYRNGVVLIERFQTETFELGAFGGLTQYSMALGGGNTGSAGGKEGAQGQAAANMDISESGKLEALHGLKAAVEALTGPSGGSVVVNEASGRFIVTAQRDIMARVRDLIHAEDQAMQRQAQIQIDVYSVITSGTDEVGVDWTLVWQNLAGTWGAAVASPTTLTGSLTGSTGIKILTPPAGSGPDWANRWGGSTAILNLLNQVGESASHRPVSLIALNRQWARKTALKTDGYVSETTPASSSYSSGGGGSPGLKTASVTTGDKFLVQPAIMDNGTILLKFGVSLTELLGLFDVTAGSGATLQKVQTPVTSGTDDQGTVRLRPGEAMVVNGLARRLSTTDRRTMGEGLPIGLGGSAKGTVKREEFMVVIRAFQV